MESMDARLVAQALNYHGQQLQKVWESDRKESELAKLNLKEPSFEIFQQRQKTLSLADIGKRLKLQQFIAKKADVLYDKANLETTVDLIIPLLGGPELYAAMPGLDSFVPMDKTQRIRNFLESLVVGDIIYAQVKGKSAAGLLLKILCNCSDCPRVISDLGVKALILNAATVPAVDKKGVIREYMVNDMVCVCVTEVNVEAERVVAAMNVTPREGQALHPSLGLVDSDELPRAYKKVMENKGKSFEYVMENSTGFNNPNSIKYLSDLMALGQENYSNMVGLRQKFPSEECSSELRQVQAGKWAFRSVAEGIQHFKAGRHDEAFQCLNKALVVDPRNVEGLVARGALHANNCSFKKAVGDFEAALKFNPTHANARKYMSETLVALGRSYEDEEKFEEAQEAYENCLAITPLHVEARKSIEFIKKRMRGAEGLNLMEKFEAFEVENGTANGKSDKKKRKKDRKSRSKKRQRWSSSSSSSSSGSSSSSSSDSSSSSSSGSSRSASRSSSRKKKHKKERDSLSPLSKRMNQYNNPTPTSSSFPESLAALTSDSRAGTEDFEKLVRKFLNQTKDESNIEEKMKILLEETSKWKRERGAEKNEKEGEKSKKKKKKERKTKDKDKEDKKSRKKKKKEERKKRKSSKDKLNKNLPVLKNSSSPDSEQLQSKLSAYYAKIEKDSTIPKRYAVNYSDMPSPFSNMEKLLASSHREDEFRREHEKEETAEKYHERDPRMSSAHQRKETQRKSFTDMFEEESQMIHPETKIYSQKRQDLPGKKRQFDSFEDIDNQTEENLQRTTFDKSLNIRKQMQRELAEKRTTVQPQRPRSPSSPPSPKEPPPTQSPLNYHSSQPLSKFQSMGTPQGSLNKSSVSLGEKFQPIGQSSSYPPEPPGPRSPPAQRQRLSKGSRSDSGSDSDRRASSRKRGSIGRPMARRMSRERPPRRYRSRSRSGSSSRSSRSHSLKRSRSRSFSNRSRRSGSFVRKYSRSVSGSYSRSRSRSRSKSYSRSRSRSRSGERRYYRNRQTRPYNNNRGNRPYHNNRGYHHYNNRGGQNFHNGNRFYQNNPNFRYNNRRGFQHGYNNYNNQNYRGRGQNRGGRFFHNNRQGFRDFRDNRRDFRDRRSYSRDRYSDRSVSPSPLRKADEAREKINKILESDDATNRPSDAPFPPNKRPEGPLSEGEERDYEDYENWGVNEGGDSANKVA